MQGVNELHHTVKMKSTSFDVFIFAVDQKEFLHSLIESFKIRSAIGSSVRETQI
jgi:hypothetical protein